MNAMATYLGAATHSREACGQTEAINGALRAIFKPNQLTIKFGSASI